MHYQMNYIMKIYYWTLIKIHNLYSVIFVSYIITLPRCSVWRFCQFKSYWQLWRSFQNLKGSHSCIVQRKKSLYEEWENFLLLEKINEIKFSYLKYKLFCIQNSLSECSISNKHILKVNNSIYNINTTIGCSLQIMFFAIVNLSSFSCLSLPQLMLKINVK